MFPDTPLPPQPITTRWGTWIEAAIYFALKFDKIVAFLNALDSEEAKSFRKAKTAITNPNLKNELAFIQCHFACIPVAITT